MADDAKLATSGNVRAMLRDARTLKLIRKGMGLGESLGALHEEFGGYPLDGAMMDAVGGGVSISSAGTQFNPCCAASAGGSWYSLTEASYFGTSLWGDEASMYITLSCVSPSGSCSKSNLKWSGEGTGLAEQDKTRSSVHYGRLPGFPSGRGLAADGGLITAVAGVSAGSSGLRKYASVVFAAARASGLGTSSPKLDAKVSALFNKDSTLGLYGNEDALYVTDFCVVGEDAYSAIVTMSNSTSSSATVILVRTRPDLSSEAVAAYSTGAKHHGRSRPWLVPADGSGESFVVLLSDSVVAIDADGSFEVADLPGWLDSLGSPGCAMTALAGGGRAVLLGRRKTVVELGSSPESPLAVCSDEHVFPVYGGDISGVTAFSEGCSFGIGGGEFLMGLFSEFDGSKHLPKAALMRSDSRSYATIDVGGSAFSSGIGPNIALGRLFGGEGGFNVLWEMGDGDGSAYVYIMNARDGE